MAKPDLSDYKEVSERIQDFRTAHPEGSLQSEILDSPFDGFVVVKGYAYRSPDDDRPGTGLAWEPVPGKTPYTKDSELQNAETSAWGRAIIAVGASDASKVASANEVRNRAETPKASDASPEAVTNKLKAEALELMGDVDEAKAVWTQVLSVHDIDGLVPPKLEDKVRETLYEMAP
jgi:hypothetical protein